MATTQPTSTPAVRTPNKFVRIDTFPLYGVLVTQESFLLGLRNLAFQHHARFLAHRTIGNRLPPELCDEIGVRLGALHSEAAEKLWKRMGDDDLDARTRKFRYGVNGSAVGLTRSEIKGLQEYSKLVRREDVSGEGGEQLLLMAMETDIDLLGAEGGDQRYVHLSATLVRPSLSMLVPGTAMCSGGGPPQMVFADEAMAVTNRLAGPSQAASETVQVAWRGHGSAARLLKVDGLEASVRGWDQEFVEGFIERLALNPVTVQNRDGPDGGGLKPEFMLLQKLMWD
jgi:hypothetical protein